MQALCLGTHDDKLHIYACQSGVGTQAKKRPTRCPSCGLPVPSDAEQKFIRLLRLYDLPEPDWYDCERGSEWHEGRFDFAWTWTRFSRPILVDIDGGNWKTITDKRGVRRSGGHANPKRIDSDLRKRNGATVSGAVVLVFTSSMIAQQPEMVADMLREVLK